MDSSDSSDATDRTFEQLVDAQDLRSVISTALTTSPIDEQALRRGIWTYVGAERDRDTSPGRVIVTLTELVEAANVVPPPVRRDVMRRVILWCVEAYFGHLGGDGVGREAAARAADRSPLPPVRVSNR